LRKSSRPGNDLEFLISYIASSSVIELQVCVARLVREFHFYEVEDRRVRFPKPDLVVPVVVGEL
jgi:hypothetical protein